MAGRWQKNIQRISQYRHPALIPSFRLVEWFLVSVVDVKFMLKKVNGRVQNDKLAGLLEWQRAEIYILLWNFALERLSRLEVSRSSAPDFEDFVQVCFSIWVICKLTVLRRLCIRYRHHALWWGIFSCVALTHTAGWARMTKEAMINLRRYLVLWGKEEGELMLFEGKPMNVGTVLPTVGISFPGYSN